MGNPVGAAFTAGDPCLVCWGVAKPFGPVPTPLFVKITFTGLAGLCSDGNQTFIAIQREFSPCEWEFEAPNFFGTWISKATKSSLILIKISPSITCFEVDDLPCTTSFTDGPATGIVS